VRGEVGGGVCVEASRPHHAWTVQHHPDGSDAISALPGHPGCGSLLVGAIDRNRVCQLIVLVETTGRTSSRLADDRGGHRRWDGFAGVDAN
jgi:hypothetical protein